MADKDKRETYGSRFLQQQGGLSAERINDLQCPPGYELPALTGDEKKHSMGKVMIWLTAVSMVTGYFWNFRDYSSGRIDHPDPYYGTASNHPEAFRKLPAEDKDIINWQILQTRAIDTKGTFNNITDDEFRQRYASPEGLIAVRAAYDKAMLEEAERKSGRDVSNPDSSPVPLKWEALTSFQQEAVDYAVDMIHRKEGSSWALPQSQRDLMRQEQLKDASKLQNMINEYRYSPLHQSLNPVGR